MNKLFLNTIAITALFALMSNACDDLKDKLNITVPLDIEESVTISSVEPGAISQDFETKENENISKYLGSIESLTLSKITYEIKTLANHAEGTEMSVSFGYSALDSSTPIEFISSENIFATLNEEVDADLTQAELDAIANLFKSDGKFKVYVNGASDGAIDAEVILRFEGKFNALD